ncbi:MAG: glycosyltransferase [Desulfobulbaceae bacterium]|nr:glycosyltransferase [Desulfobulbaceae bacterium]
MFILGGLLFLSTILFVQTLVLPSQLTLPPAVEQLKNRLKSQQNRHAQSNPLASKPLWLDFAKKHPGLTGGALPPVEIQKSVVAPPQKASISKDDIAAVQEIRLGFYQSWDPGSLDSLKVNAGKLTHLSPDWLSVADGLGKLNLTQEQDVLDLVNEHGKLILVPLLSNLVGKETWRPEAVEGVINGPEPRQEQFLANLVEELKGMEAGGVMLDWQQIDPSYRDAMTAFLKKMATELHKENLELWLCVPTGRDLSVFDMDILAEHLDHFVAMLHDENGEYDPAGPIASRDFFNGWLATLVDGYGKPSQWVISLGSYGYDWTDGEEKAESLSFQDVMSRAGRSLLTSCDFNAPTYNPHFSYEDSASMHTVWFLDAVTFLNQLITGRAHQVGGFAISRLGTEDPGIWDALKIDTDKPLERKNIAKLETIKPGDAIARIGKGNLITIIDERADGSRSISIDQEKGAEVQTSANYEKFPTYLTIMHQGKGPDNAVALTFDDGPDADWTPQILDILKNKGVSATFFMVGANMENHPDLVKRIVREGHIVGVHTYSHPNIALVSEERAHLELNATQRLLEAITDHSTILFRPPYNADTNPHDAEEIVPIKIAQKMGYLTETEDIDPQDWSEPGVATMLETIKKGRLENGNIILLHDAGGDRSQTVEALPKIIDYLRARGDAILPLSDILEIPLEQLMPVVPQHQQPITRMISESGFTVIHEVTNFFWAFMLVATGLTILKTLIVSWLAIRSRKASDADLLAQPVTAEACPPVSVLIAAYNEEKVIRETLLAVLKTNYTGMLEVIVVDDGSKDRTAEIVTAMMQEDERIRLIRQVNFGKATALKNGIKALQYEIFVSLDADTQFTPDTIGELVRPFADPAVGAVSGRARVGNPKTLFARFQSLEYTCGFNLDRRAYHQLNCITVVPGAVSAFKVSAIRDAGGISTETLAEDTDLTLSLHKCGYKICYTALAVAWTEAPETVSAFAKQRFRWAFGTLQCLWKHRELLFNPKYRALGWFSLPSAWFFNIMLVAMGSLIDCLLLFSLLVSPANGILYFYFLIFLIADLLLAWVACRIEKEPLRQIWLVLPMRFIYRPVLSFVVMKAILKAIKGAWVGWGKLDRTASVTYRA